MDAACNVLLDRWHGAGELPLTLEMLLQGYEYFLCLTTIAHVIITTYLSGTRTHGPPVFIGNVNYSVLNALDYALCILFT
jgi:hypothetical protein